MDATPFIKVLICNYRFRRTIRQSDFRLHEVGYYQRRRVRPIIQVVSRNSSLPIGRRREESLGGRVGENLRRAFVRNRNQEGFLGGESEFGGGRREGNGKSYRRLSS